MACHETKYCPRCQAQFECKVGNVTECQCYGISFEEKEKEYIDRNYQDCLCRNCLLSVKREMQFKPAEEKMKQILSINNGQFKMDN